MLWAFDTRVCVCVHACSKNQSGAVIAIHYAEQRRQVGACGAGGGVGVVVVVRGAEMDVRSAG